MLRNTTENQWVRKLELIFHSGLNLPWNENLLNIFKIKSRRTSYTSLPTTSFYGRLQKLELIIHSGLNLPWNDNSLNIHKIKSRRTTPHISSSTTRFYVYLNEILFLELKCTAATSRERYATTTLHANRY